MVNRKQIGAYIKLKRLEKGCNSTRFAKMCNYSRPYLSQIENGKIEVSEEVYKNIFKYLDVDYEKYIASNKEINNKINDLIRYILFNNRRCELLYEELHNLKNEIKESNYYNRYLLCEFVYLVFSNKNQNKIEEIAKIIKSHITLYEDKDTQLFLIYYAIFIRSKKSISSSMKILFEALNIGEFSLQTGMCFYQLGISNEMAGKYLLAYRYYLKAEKSFSNEGNVKRYLYTKIDIANVLSRVGQVNEAISIYVNLLENHVFDKDATEYILRNKAHFNMKLKNYQEALLLLKKINVKKDNARIMELKCYANLKLKEEFLKKYNRYVLDVEDDLYKEEIELLYYEYKKLSDHYKYIELLKNHYENIVDRFDVELVIDNLNKLIKYYISVKKYKEVSYYLHKKNDLYEGVNAVKTDTIK